MAVLLSLISSLMWGASDFAGGLLSRRHPAIVIVGIGACFGLTLATVAVLFSGGWTEPYGWVPWGVAAGAAGSAGLVGYYLALSTGTMGVVAPVTSLGVVVPVVIGFLSGESPGSLVLLGIAVAIVGIVLTSGPEFAGGASAKPVLIAAFAGLCFGVFFVVHGPGLGGRPAAHALDDAGRRGDGVRRRRRSPSAACSASRASTTCGSHASAPVTSAPT